MPARASSSSSPSRALRGLFLTFCLSLLNLAGAFLTLMALGGLGAWSGPQFFGLFGLIEASTGLATIIGPNIWRLPVAEANTSDRTTIRLAASTVLRPHWAAGAKTIAGLGMIGVAVADAGVGVATLALPLVIALLAVAVLGLSLLVARFGVARPDLDVIFLVVKRPGKPDQDAPGISIGAMALQLILNIGTFPAVKVLPPSILFRPEIGPSITFIAVSAAAALALSLAAVWAWRGRIARRAPREQQREAEQFA